MAETSGSVRPSTTVLWDISCWYRASPLLVDRRGQLATQIGRDIFHAYQFSDDGLGIRFQHALRILEIRLDQARLVAKGPAGMSRPLTDLMFRLLETFGVPGITTARMISWHVAPSSEPYETMVQRQIGSHWAPLEPTEVGTIIDFGAIYTVRTSGGRVVNVHVGPMRADQWSGVTGQDLAFLVPELPAIGWGIGLYDNEPASVDQGLSASKRYILDTMSDWSNVAQRVLPEVTSV